MSNLQDLIDFINNSGDSEYSWSQEKWENELTRTIPTWRAIVQDLSSWTELENVRPKYKYTDVFWEALLKGTGTKGQVLAEKWLLSSNHEHQRAARIWFNHYYTSSMWSGFDQQHKSRMLCDCWHALLEHLTSAIWNNFDDEKKNQLYLFSVKLKIKLDKVFRKKSKFIRPSEEAS